MSRIIPATPVQLAPDDNHLLLRARHRFEMRFPRNRIIRRSGLDALSAVLLGDLSIAMLDEVGQPIMRSRPGFYTGARRWR